MRTNSNKVKRDSKKSASNLAAQIIERCKAIQIPLPVSESDHEGGFYLHWQGTDAHKIHVLSNGKLYAELALTVKEDRFESALHCVLMTLDHPLMKLPLRGYS
jgi:hypothetical protein